MRKLLMFFSVFAAAIFALCLPTGSVGAQDALAPEASKSTDLPDQFRSKELGNIEKSRQTVYVDQLTARMNADGELWLDNKGDCFDRPFIGESNFPSMKVVAGLISEKEGKRLKIFSVEIFDHPLFSPRHYSTGEIFTAGDPATRIKATEVVWRGKRSKLVPEELRGFRIWELHGRTSAWVSTRYLKVDEDGLGWLPGWIPVRHQQFEDEFGQAARITMYENGAWVDFDLEGVTRTFKTQGGKRPAYKYLRTPESREKDGLTAAGLVDLLYVRKFITPPPSPGELAQTK